MIEAAHFKLGAETEISVAVQQPTESIAGLPIVPWKHGLSAPADAWIIALATVPIFEAPSEWAALTLPGSARERQGKQLYVLEPHGMIHLLETNASGGFEVRMGSKYEPYLDEHIFSRISPRGFRGNAYPFPYNGYYEALASAFGPVKSFGFRFDEDIQVLEQRGDDVFVGVVFGGSCVLSPACLQNETFSSRLAVMLSEYFSQNPGRYRRAHILNFGNSGATVINELITYLLFAQRLSPEIVIAHDIFNDFAHGLRTDPVLLGKYQITYLPEMESWARTLMGTMDVELTQHSDGRQPFAVRSGPQTIVKSYLYRKQQFMSIVERSASEFIYGIQPAWFSKRPSVKEAKKHEEIRHADRHNSPLYEFMERLYGMALKQLSENRPKHFIDIHSEFSKYGAEEDLFVDHAHLNPIGDLRIAEIYFKYISENILPSMHFSKD
jgi:hypothetical protein